MARFSIALKRLIPYRAINLKLSSTNSKQNLVILRLNLTLYDMSISSLSVLTDRIYPEGSYVFELVLRSMKMMQLPAETNNASYPVNSADSTPIWKSPMVVVLRLVDSCSNFEAKIKSMSFAQIQVGACCGHRLSVSPQVGKI